MDATVQMNTRLGRTAKAEGDSVLAQLGYSPSQAVRALWDYLREHRDVPPFMKEAARDDALAEKERKLALVKGGGGLALSVARESCGYTGPATDLLGVASWRELRNEMYDDMLDEMEGRCG